MSNVARNRKYRSTPKGKFCLHKANATRRGILFILSFDAWWQIWQLSGKWAQRGTKPEQYVMCRYFDIGAYEVDNVYIDTVAHNLHMARVKFNGVRRRHTLNTTEVDFADIPL